MQSNVDLGKFSNSTHDILLEEKDEEQKMSSDSKSDSFKEMRRELKSLRKEIAQLSREANIDLSEKSISSDGELDAGDEDLSEQTEQESVKLITKVYNTMRLP